MPKSKTPDCNYNKLQTEKGEFFFLGSETRKKMINCAHVIKLFTVWFHHYFQLNFNKYPISILKIVEIMYGQY